ncbi:hypothetical protein [Celeribacter neptunius]|uniref:Alpha 1,4-glycosyltransferase conserved region n=1 Tax=Celeribacter neptunius TaxID=588602 RepID=A0A1I3QLS5_9RHOB|nr:hypothetical protein [Celeribacter neptunius]SFJ34479.1 hypothetical protein SAMN04487991_1871 [Celeribacter neptunius]
MPQDASLPTVSSLWIGGDLGWLEHLCLTSFVAAGQPTVLYHYAPVGNVPDGVEMRDARTVFEMPEKLAAQTAPSYVADMFRIHLMQHTDEIWIDTDIVCHAPLRPDAEGFLIGWTPWHAEINNCILRLPRGSQTLAELMEFLSDLSRLPPWVRPKLRQRLERTPLEERLVARYHTLRTIIGPKALTHLLKETGEASHAQEPDVLSPVPWQYVDVLFNPHGGWQGWTSEETRSMHLWSNMLKHHKKQTLQPGSYLAQWAEKLDVPTP